MNDLGQIDIWEQPSGNLRRSLGDFRGLVLHACISPDGKVIAATSGNNIIALWDAQTGQLKRVMKEREDTCANSMRIGSKSGAREIIFKHTLPMEERLF